MRCSWRDEPAATSARTAAGSADPRGWGLRLVLPRERRRAADRQSQVCATRACVQGPLTPGPSPAKGPGESKSDLIALSPLREIGRGGFMPPCRVLAGWTRRYLLRRRSADLQIQVC